MEFWVPPRRRTLPPRIVPCALALATALLPRAVAQRPREPYSEAEVVQALGAEVPPKRIVELVRQNGIAFELISETEAKLRRAGATAELLGVLRSLHSTAPRLSGPLLIKSNPPGAQVFLDGKPVGTTNAQGELGLGPHPPGECKVRLTLTGHEDHEQTISLVAGQPVSVRVTLK